MPKNQSQVSDLYLMFLATNWKGNVVFASYYLSRGQKNLSYKSNPNLIKQELQPHKRVTFLKICKYNISVNQNV